jgi:hypothetical protein
MSSTFTTNKDLEQPANGDYVNNWNVANNNNFSVVDAALGRVATINVTGISTTPNLLNSVLGSAVTNPNSQTVGIFQYQCQSILFTGTISANLVYQIPSGISGTWNVYNASSGAFTITIRSAGSVAGGVVLTQAMRMQVTSDGGVNYGVTPTMSNFFSTITDVSSSRVFGTTYTNSSGKPLFVMISATPPSTGGNVFVYVNSILCAQAIGVYPFSATCMVPAGVSYYASTSSSSTLNSWVEVN